MFRIIKDGLPVIETQSVSILIEWLEKQEEYVVKEIEIVPMRDD